MTRRENSRGIASDGRIPLPRGPLGAEAAALRFRGARRELVERHLDTLAFMRELHADAEGRYHALRAAG